MRWDQLAGLRGGAGATSASSLSSPSEDCPAAAAAARENLGSCCLPLPKKGRGQTAEWPLSFRTILCVNTFLGMIDLKSLLLDWLGLSYWYHAIWTPPAFLMFYLNFFSSGFLPYTVPFKIKVKSTQNIILEQNVLKGKGFSLCPPIIPFPTT